MYCAICGDDRGFWRTKQRMTLCNSCFEDTPAKCTLGEFVTVTFAMDPDFDFSRYSDRAIAKDFYEDYKVSTFSDPAEYWAACSSEL